MDIKVFLSRIGPGSLGRFFRNLNIVHEQSGKNRVGLFLDMAYSMVKYDIGYLDYLTFGFAYIGHDKRKTFMTMSESQRMSRELNPREFCGVFKDKLEFCKTFKSYLNRDYVDLREGFEDFEAFCRGKEHFFAKVTGSYGGYGIEKIHLKDHSDLKELYDELLDEGMFLAEETIVQHPEMNKLCARSVNTIRIVTVISDKGNPNVVYCLVRIGSGSNDVDNVSSGGMYTMLTTDGRINHPAFCDKTVTYYTKHPASGFEFKDFQVPYFEEAKELCRKAALVEPKVRYVGWDVAITPNGPVLVEGNYLPGYDMCQNHRFHDDGCGIKPAFEAALKN